MVDHLALTCIIKSKMELATTRIKRLQELISSYSFNIYYMKGNDMIFSDFLLQQYSDDSNPSEIMPISFNIYKILEENRKFGKCNNIINNTSAHEKYLIQTCSQAKSSGMRLPEVHGVQKELDLKLRPEKQRTTSKHGKLERPQVGQGRAGLKRRKPDHINQPTNQSLDVTLGIPRGTKIEQEKQTVHKAQTMCVTDQ